jgi:hypothetical protein
LRPEDYERWLFDDFDAALKAAQNHRKRPVVFIETGQAFSSKADSRFHEGGQLGGVAGGARGGCFGRLIIS